MTDSDTSLTQLIRRDILLKFASVLTFWIIDCKIWVIP